jgi:deoxyribonuclease V
VRKVEIERLKEEQKKLSRKLILKDDFSEITTLAGCEIVFTKDEMIAVVVLLDYNTHALIDKKYFVTKPKIPYIPLFQSYREVPAVIEAVNLLAKKPDMIIYDGCGILHPLKMGCAAHLGLLLDTPSIGVSKKYGIGCLKEGIVYVGEEKRAVEMSTKEHANPLYISPGHRISLKTSEEIVRGCLKEGSKLPEPLRIAHNYGVYIKKNRLHKQDVEKSLDSIEEDFPGTETA